MVESHVIGITPAKHADEHKTTGSDPLSDPIITTAHHTTHEVGGADEVTGLLAIHDGSEAIVRAAANGVVAWTDLDLSATIGAKRSYVDLILRNNNAANGIVVGARPKGSTHSLNISVTYFGTHKAYAAAGVNQRCRFTTMTDENGVIQLYASNATSYELRLSSYIN